MAIQLTQPEYETKPVDCWQRMKELRRWRFRNNWEARSRGDLVICGMHMGSTAGWAGFGDYADMSFSPYYTRLARDPNKLVELMEFIDSKGYGQQVCGALKVHLASLLKGWTAQDPSGNPFLPDFVYQGVFCPQVGRMGRMVAEQLNLPYLYSDATRLDTKRHRDYHIAQTLENIERVEKMTGRKYDDEKLINAFKNEWRTYTLWTQICVLNKAIPAPLDARHLLSLRLPGLTLQHKKECVEYFETLLDEVKDRVQKGISARGFERKRLLMEMFPWVEPGVVRYPEEYGAVAVCGEDPFQPARFHVDENGVWSAPKSLDELGIELRNREDVFNAQFDLAQLYVSHGSYGWHIDTAAPRPISMAKDWHCDAMVIASVRDCFLQGQYQLETKLLASAEGMPTLHYNICIADPRQFDGASVRRRMDVFLQSLGLTRIFTN